MVEADIYPNSGVKKVKPLPFFRGQNILEKGEIIMGDTKSAGSGAPPATGGIVNAAMGNQAYSETGKDSGGHEVTGYGSTRDQANTDYQKKGGKT
jgi:hypothetical protein